MHPGLSLCQEPLPRPTCQNTSAPQPGLSLGLLLHEAFLDLLSAFPFILMDLTVVRALSTYAVSLV